MATSTSFYSRLAERARGMDASWRWAIGVYLGARVFYTLWSLVVILLFPTVLQNLNLFGVPVVAYFEVATGERFVYARTVNGQVLIFRGAHDAEVRDTETNSMWSLRSAQAVQGAQTGRTLEPASYTVEDVFPYHGVALEHGWFGVWQRFDVLWYQAIAERGYGATPGDIHFPPLYPLLENLFARGVRSTFVAGWLISQLAVIGSLYLLYRLTASWKDERTARRALIFLVIFPTAFFLFTAYSEALFLLLTLLCFDSLRGEKFTRAGFWAFLAILTRLQGVALFLPLAYKTWRKVRVGKNVSATLLFGLGIPFLAGAFYLYLRAVAGETAIVPTNEAQLNARLAPVWENVLYAVQIIASGKFSAADVLNLGVFVWVIVLVARGWRLLPMEYGLYAAATLVAASVRFVDTQPLNSMTRYVLTLFPLFMILAHWSEKRWVERAVIYVSLPLNLYLSAQFLLWGWVA